MAKPTGAVFWSGLEAGCAAALSFASAFLIARLVGPAELGIGAAVVAPQVLLCVAVNALFADAIAQRPALDEATASSAFWASVAVGCGAALVQAGTGALLVHALSDPRLPAMALALALPLPLVGAAGAAQGRLTVQRRYRDLARRTVVGQGLGTAVGVALALSGAGAWAVVAQQVATSGIGAAALVARAGWRPHLLCHLGAVRGLLAVGLPLVASTLVQHGRYRLFAMLLGDLAGPATLGQVHLAFRLVDTVKRPTATALWRLMLPSFAARQHRPGPILRRPQPLPGPDRAGDVPAMGRHGADRGAAGGAAAGAGMGGIRRGGAAADRAGVLDVAAFSPAASRPWRGAPQAILWWPTLP